MKRILIFFLVISLAVVGVSAMSKGKVRENARFLTDRMYHELNLSSAQYNDVYEINFDFIYGIRYLMDDVVMGDIQAQNEYYRLLEYRNDDLRWVLTFNQFSKLMGLDYFYRPVFASVNGWSFRIYNVYTNPDFFYFGKPSHYRSYGGGHYRTHFNNVSYYKNRYHHGVYRGNLSLRDNDNYHKADFGTRPSSTPNSRPSSGSSVSTRPSGSSSGRPSSTGSSARPSNSTRPSSSEGSSNTSRPSSSSTRENNSSGNSNRSSRVSERPSSSRDNSSKSSENRSSSTSSGSNRGGRR